MNNQENSIELISVNRSATFKYAIEQTIEAGIVLFGSEVKSIRENAVSINAAYAAIIDQELWLVNSSVEPYRDSRTQHKTDRNRKLLVRKREIAKLKDYVSLPGRTLIPIKIYLSKGLIKIEIGLCVGKKMHDKRQHIKERDARTQIKNGK